MRIITISALLLMAAVFLVPQASAQRAGFITAGIPPVVNSPVMPFVSSPVTPFGVAPTITLPIISTFPSHFVHGHGFPIVQTPFVVGPQFVPQFVPNNGVTVIVPNGTVIAPGSVIAPRNHLFPPNGLVTAGPATVIAGPGSVIGPSNVVVGPLGPGSVFGGGSVVTAGPIVAPAPVHVPLGTPRAQVIQQLGAPVVTIVTRDGEMLGFTGGVTIFLQNGLVAVR